MSGGSSLASQYSSCSLWCSMAAVRFVFLSHMINSDSRSMCAQQCYPRDTSGGVVKVRYQVQIPHAWIFHDMPVCVSHGIRVGSLVPYPLSPLGLCWEVDHQIVGLHYSVYSGVSYIVSLLPQTFGRPQHALWLVRVSV